MLGHLLSLARSLGHYDGRLLPHPVTEASLCSALSRGHPLLGTLLNMSFDHPSSARCENSKARAGKKDMYDHHDQPSCIGCVSN